MKDLGHPANADGLSSQAMEPQASPPEASIPDAAGWVANEIQVRENLSGYYFSFEPTGNPHIDTILGAIGFAGKMYHGTEDWDEEISYYGDGFSCITNIQNAANAAAKAMETGTAKTEGLGAEHDSAARRVCPEPAIIERDGNAK